MTMEINEIGIRMRVQSGVVQRAPLKPGGGASEEIEDGCPGSADGERDSIVEACTRRVLQALKASRER